MADIDFVYFDAGGGHRAAATALRAVIEQQGRPWRIRMVNLQEVLDELDLFRRLFGIRLQDVYNLLLKKGWTLGSPQLTVLMHWIIRQYHPAQVRLLDRFWRKTRPDLVVSLIPNFNRAMYQGLQAAHPGTPFVTVITDIADYPPHFWIEPDQEQHFVCGSEKAVQQALALKHAPERVHRVSGMILNPKFYEPAELDRAAERRKLGLDPGRPTGIVMFGGQGSSVMVDIVRRVEESKLDTQFILVCGKNQKLAAALRSRQSRLKLFVEGFTSEVPYYMRLADYFVGKPGPGSLSEALAMRLPVIVERNAWTLPQERYNADWIRTLETGLVVGNFRHVSEALATLLEPERLARYQANAAQLTNRAVFEIPGMLEGILKHS